MAYFETLDHPPLYITVTDSRDSRNDYQRELEASAAFLKSCDDCVWLRVSQINQALPKASRENNEARKRWMERNQEVMRQKVKAIVNVVGDPFYEQAKKIRIEKAYGVCGTCCKTLQEALDWIAEHVSLRGVAGIDQRQVLEAVKSLND